MIKTKTVETIEEYGSDGKLVRKTTTETEETNDSPTQYTHTSAPYIPPYTFCGTGFQYNPGPSSFCSEDKT